MDTPPDVTGREGGEREGESLLLCAWTRPPSRSPPSLTSRAERGRRDPPARGSSARPAGSASLPPSFPPSSAPARGPPGLFPARHRHRHHGPPAALLEPPEEVRARVPLLPRVLEPPRPDPQVRPQHVPPVLPPVRQGHRLHQDGLNDAGR